MEQFYIAPSSLFISFDIGNNLTVKIVYSKNCCQLINENSTEVIIRKPYKKSLVHEVTMCSESGIYLLEMGGKTTVRNIN